MTFPGPWMPILTDTGGPWPDGIVVQARAEEHMRLRLRVERPGSIHVDTIVDTSACAGPGDLPDLIGSYVGPLMDDARKIWAQ